ncbi:MAG: glycoside hydrolase family 43 protein [Niabella sp.]
MKYRLLILCCLFSVFCDAQQLKQTIQQQVIPGELPDPSVIKVGNVYYACGSSNNWGPYYPVYQSKDLKRWEFVNYVFSQKPGWTKDSYWAPELYYENGIFYCYYTARRIDGISCIGVAATKDIKKGFTDHGVIVEWGNEAIDAFVYNEKGTKYITWKAYGLTPGRPIQILGSALTKDGLKLSGEAFEVLTANEDNWEKGGIEGQCFVKKGDYIYMLYSGNACCGGLCDYQVGVARAKTMKGPWEKNPSNPVLKGNDIWKCPGHGTVVKTGNKFYYLYHAYHSYGFPYLGRSAMLSQLYWDDRTQWPYFNLINENIHPAQLRSDIVDEFEGKLADWWRFDVSTYLSAMEISGARLRLKDQPLVEGKQIISVIAAVPEYADFETRTAVIPVNNVMSGLVYYATNKRYLAFGLKDNKLQVLKSDEGNFDVLSEVQISPIGAVYLKSIAKGANQFDFLYSTDNVKWTKMPLPAHLTTDYLSWWSWGMKVGLFVKADEGSQNKSGEFEEFSLRYL